MHPYHRRRHSDARLAAITEYLGDPAGLKILDLGALDGWFSHQLANRGALCTAADDHPTLTEAPGVTVINERLTPTKIRALGEFDAAICLSALHHMPSWRATLNALLAVAPLVFVETAHPDETLPKASHHKDSGRITNAIEKAGGVAITTTPGYDAKYQRPLWVIDNRPPDGNTYPQAPTSVVDIFGTGNSEWCINHDSQNTLGVFLRASLRGRRPANLRLDLHNDI
ncbi:MAG: hypothetical protein K0U84_24860 [Actinomycetia bacterium]|nr:hypothetical protein [Actinomycetes bacterium]